MKQRIDLSVSHPRFVKFFVLLPCQCYLHILCMFLVTYPANLVAWSMVLVLPINPIIIPVIFIVSAVRKKLKSNEKRNIKKL